MTASRLAALAVAAIGANAGLQQSMTLVVGDNRILVTNVDALSGLKLLHTGIEHHATAAGNPVQVVVPEMGLTARGRSIDITWADLGPKQTEVRAGRFEGDATLVFDSDAAGKALAEDAKAKGLPLPEPNPGSSFEQIDSDLFTYAGTAAHGTITLPNAWTFKQVTKGSRTVEKHGVPIAVAYDQMIDANGTGGHFDVAPGPDGALNQVQSGLLAGPVHFRIVRHETPGDTNKLSTSTYTGVADNVDINLVSHPGTLAARGHVTVNADTGTLSSRFLEDRFVFLVNEKLEPTGLQFFGHPGITTAKLKEGVK